MSIKFKELSIQNFLSFGQKPITINLDSSQNTLIVGENRDVGSEGYSKNGVGKSTIFQALTWVIYNEGISSIKQDAFVNIINKKNMVVTLNMEVNDINYTIRRGRKPAICEILINNEPYTNHSINTVDETIEDLMGINYDTFCNTVMLNTTTTPFMNLKPAAQRNFMERMVGLDILSERADTIKSKNKDISIEIKLEEQNKEHVLQNFQKAINNVNYLKDKESEWKKSNKTSIEDTKENIEIMSAVDTVAIMKTNEKIRNQNNVINEIKSKIEGIVNEQSDEIYSANIQYISEKKQRESSVDLEIANIEKKGQKDIVDLISGKSTINADLADNKELLTEATNVIKESHKTIIRNTDKIKKSQEEVKTLESGECPYCHQTHFDNDKVDDINVSIKNLSDDSIVLRKDCLDIEETLDDIKDNISNFTDKITAIDSSVLTIEIQYNQVTQSLENDSRDAEEVLHQNHIDCIKNIKEKYKDISGKLHTKMSTLVSNQLESKFTDEECHQILNDIKHQVERLKTLKKEVNPYTEQVGKAEEDIIEYDESILVDLLKKENHYKMLVKLLTDNKSYIRKNLLDMYTPFINQKIEHYLNKVELPHRVVINNDLSVDITYMTHSVSYGNMSKGESVRTNFAVSLSFRDLMSVSGHKFNFLGIDELLDSGLDSSGFYSISKLLKERTDETVFIISHREELIAEADEVYTVIKENGFTHISK